tara:strand:- start:520 stop:672 length:153 start_codon:yes stop_codon:yes gene_type:complete
MFRNIILLNKNNKNVLPTVKSNYDVLQNSLIRIRNEINKKNKNKNISKNI